MKEVKIGNKKVLMYSDPEELTVELYKLYTKYLAIESDIGDDFNAVSSKLNDIILIAGDTEKVITEVNNLRQTIYNIYNSEVSIESKVFAIMVYSINDERCKDKSEEGLSQIINSLAGLKVKEVKKKIMK
ncbi:MAG: hypothetical protein EOL88_02280 [Bacteroidia bacterium]|nr:hypothetical protein [Bacteroidia bacterium]